MEKFLVKEYIGEFFSKMYKANERKNIEITLLVDEDKIQIYNKEKFTFEYVKLIDEKPTIDGLVNSLSK